mgnify:CR=1 FL=1
MSLADLRPHQDSCRHIRYHHSINNGTQRLIPSITLTIMLRGCRILVQTLCVDTARDAAPAANAQAEGSDFSASAVASTSTARVGNYSQILTKHIQVSKTLDSVSKAGRNSEFAYQMKKKGTELKRDLEHALVGARQVTNGSGGADGIGANAGRTMGGYQSWVPAYNTWNVSAGTPGFAGGSHTAAAGTAAGGAAIRSTGRRS